MNGFRGSRFIVFVLAGLLAACSGGHETPTDPSSMVRLTFHLQTASAQVQRTSLWLDGREVVTTEAPGGAADVTLETVVTGVAHGSHTIRVVIEQQISSPNEYVAGGAVEGMGLTQDLAAARGILATGEGLEFRFRL